MNLKNYLSKVDWTILLRFLICGGVTTALDFIVYRCLIGSLGPAAKSISFCCGAGLSFFLNRKWTFRYHGKMNGLLIFKFAVAQGANLAVNSGINYVALQITHHLVFAFLCATACGMIVNFTLQRVLVFRRTYA